MRSTVNQGIAVNVERSAVRVKLISRVKEGLQSLDDLGVLAQPLQ